MNLIQLHADVQLAEMRYNSDPSEVNLERLENAKDAYERARSGGVTPESAPQAAPAPADDDDKQDDNDAGAAGAPAAQDPKKSSTKGGSKKKA